MSYIDMPGNNPSKALDSKIFHRFTAPSQQTITCSIDSSALPQMQHIKSVTIPFDLSLSLVGYCKIVYLHGVPKIIISDQDEAEVMPERIVELHKEVTEH